MAIMTHAAPTAAAPATQCPIHSWCEAVHELPLDPDATHFKTAGVIPGLESTARLAVRMEFPAGFAPRTVLVPVDLDGRSIGDGIDLDDPGVVVLLKAAATAAHWAERIEATHMVEAA